MTGFLSADRETLSGVYNQGASFPLEFRRATAGGGEQAVSKQPASAVPVGNASLKEPGEYAFGGYIFKLINNDTIGEVYENARIVGSVYTISGKPQVMPTVAEPEASKVRKAFEDWQASNKSGSTAPPEVPVSFEPDGSATVPVPDGTVVIFKPAYAEVNQPNLLSAASIPGQAPITDVRFTYKEPSLLKEFASGDSGITINGKDLSS